jgi:endonuclease/exonuclease/phosphatase (EEP) superfamily protein YafD
MLVRCTIMPTSTHAVFALHRRCDNEDGILRSLPQARVHRPLQTIAGLAALAVAACGLAAPCLPITNHVALFAALFLPYLVVCAPASAILFILARRRVLAIAAMTLTVAVVLSTAAVYPPPGNGTAGIDVRIISANILEGQADPASLVRLALAQADVLAVQELTPQEADRLSAGLRATFPYQLLDARDEASGVGLWSRFPVRAATRIVGYEMAFVTAQIQLTGLSVDPAVVVLHIPQPIDLWRSDLGRLPLTLRDIANQVGDGCVIVAGDFNSTAHLRPFRDLLHNGYRDGSEQARAAMGPTYPADSWLPPFVTLDHILTRNCRATSLRTVHIPGSDHRGLVATVAM